MNYVLFDPIWRDDLLPFTHTRPAADIRCGILTFRERWERLLGATTYSLCPDYMQGVYPHAAEGECLYINGSVFADKQLLAQLAQLKPDTVLAKDSEIIAIRLTKPFSGSLESLIAFAAACVHQEHVENVSCVRNLWDIFQLNGTAIEQDFSLLTEGRFSDPLPDFVTAIHPENIFIEAGAQLSPCVLNATNGPIYIAADASIMDGCLVRGPFALGAHAALKMGAKVYGPTTIGKGCKVGGEVSNVVFFANSNKGHDGFLGNSVVGEWCNFGADTNCSNLKNNYDKIKIWSEAKQTMVDTGLQFCGLMMGDHSKCGINTMFNTGTVVGVSANIFGAGFPDKFVPSFSWGACESTEIYQFDKAMETAARMMERRGKTLDDHEKKMLRHIFDLTTHN